MFRLCASRGRAFPIAVTVLGALVLALFQGGGSAVAQDGAEIDGAEREVAVFYVSNRHHQARQPPDRRYDGDRGPAHFGHCGVTFTPIRFADQVGSNLPFYVPRETVEISAADRIDVGAYWDRLTAAVAETSSRSAVVFVHGYNYSFERTCRMAAEMQRSLAGDAVVVMFSWPSNGNPADYVSDLTDMEWSVPLLADFLAQLGERLGPEGVQVLAHSMGSRGTMAALQRLGVPREARPVVGRLVLLAPDYDSQTFVDRLPELAPLVGNVTLYASSNDSPLMLSRQLSGHPRLGEAGEFLTVVDGVETIDVTPAGIRQVFGHEYFFYHPVVAADLRILLSTGHGAAERPGLRSRRRNGLGYWELPDGP